MGKHVVIGALVALALTASGCGGGDADAPPPGAAAGAAPAVPAPPAPPAVTVASCTTTTAAGTLCDEFNQAQYASLGAAGVLAICTREVSNVVRTNVPCSPFDQLGSCIFRDHVMYDYRGGAARESDYRAVCGTMTGRYMAGGQMGEPGPDAVHPDANTALAVDQAVLYLCPDGCTATRIARVVDLLPDGRVTVEDQGERATVTRDRIWVGSYTALPNGLGNNEADDFPTITDAPLPAGTEVWAKDTWWYRGVVVEDTGADRLRVDLYGYVSGPQEVTRRNVRLHR